ncbi:MAG: transposase [Gammaproteobacteria bacterium]|nr:transposase [Gammaproteobacteria bacterium]
MWIKAPCGRERFNVLGELNAVTKEVITLTHTGYINLHSVCALLQKLRTQTRPDLPISVVLDNARYQRCVLVQNVATDLQIELLFLPTYSPNLNTLFARASLSDI